jgi:flagellar basal-body rod protein FlgC
MTAPITSSMAGGPMPVAPKRPEPPRPMFSALAIASSGLSAQRVRMEVIAQNLANAETTRTPEGGPYQRRIVNLEAIKPQDANAATGTSASDATTAPASVAGAVAAPGANAPANPTTNDPTKTDAADVSGGVRVASIGTDKTEGALVYDPGHPDADKNGYVRMPNVSITDEMMDLMNARRLYEANATVFQVARAMLHKALDI